MKLLLLGVLIAGGYYVALTNMTDRALGSLQTLNDTYQYVAKTSEQWAAGNTTHNLAPSVP